MRRLGLRSIKSKVLLSFLVIALIPLLMAGVVVNLLAVSSLTEEVQQHLLALANLQARRLDALFARDEERLSLVASRTQLRLSLMAWTRRRDPDARMKMNRILRDARDSVKEFRDLYVTDPAGLVVAATDERLIGQDWSGRAWFQAAGRRHVVVDYYRDPRDGLSRRLVAPLRWEDEVIGMVVIVAGADALLELVGDHTGLGRSGETLIARRIPDGAEYLTPLRFDPDAALRRREPLTASESPVVIGLRERRAIVTRGVAYTGREVIAATRYLPGRDWVLVTQIERTEALAPVRELQLTFLGHIVAAVLITTIVAVTLSDSLVRPIQRLTRAAEAISKGDWAQRVDLKSRDELGQLARAFDTMAAELTRYNQHLEELVAARTEELQREVAARKAREAEIRQLNEGLARRAEALQALNEDLEAYTHSATHDLRTPLRTVHNYAQLLAGNLAERLSEDERALLEGIVRNTRRMDRVITDILAYSSVGGRPLEPCPVDMERLIREICAELRQAHAERELEFHIGPLPTVVGDLRLLRQAFANLLDNAVKYSVDRRPARIEISGEATPAERIYHVRDNGIGFEMKYSRQIFEVFKRLHGSDTFPGTGLGLSIVQRIVRRHGGRIWAESPPEGGAVFHVALPSEPREVKNA